MKLWEIMLLRLQWQNQRLLTSVWKTYSVKTHITQKPIRFANYLTGFLTIRVLTERYFRTKFKLLLTVMSYSQMTYDLIIMGCIFQNKLVSQKQSSKSFHQISIFQVIDNSQEVIWDSSKILKSSNNNNNEKRKKLLNGGGEGVGGLHRVFPTIMSDFQSTFL